MKDDYRRRPIGLHSEPVTSAATVEAEADEPATVEVERGELERLRARSKHLDTVLGMARSAFNRGSLSTADDLPSIALAAKIISAAGQPL